MKNIPLKIIFLAIGYLLSCPIVYTQPTQDFVITLTQDTVYGAIPKNGYDQKRVVFIDDIDQKEYRYNPEEIQGFLVNGMRFVSKTFQVDGGKGRRFLQILVEGETSLYRSSTAFYLDKRGELIELTKRDEIGDYSLKEDKRYQGILKYQLSDCQEIPWADYDKLSFSQKEFTELLVRYNTCKHPNQTTKVFRKERKIAVKIGFQVGVGVSQIVRLDETESPFLVEMENMRETGLVLSPFLKLRISRKLSGQLHIQYSQRKATELRYYIASTFESQEKRTYEFKLLDIPVLANWEILQSKSHCLFIQGGFLFGFTLEKSDTAQRGWPTWDSNTATNKIPIIKQNTSRQGVQIGGGYSFKAFHLTYVYERSAYWDYRFDSHGINLSVVL